MNRNSNSEAYGDWFQISEAMITYLGGKPDEPAIQIGNREERLFSRYGKDSAKIKPLLDAILSDALNYWHSDVDDGPNDVYLWLGERKPELNSIARQKISAYVFFEITH